MAQETGRGFRVALDSNLAQRKGIFAVDLSDLKAKTISRFKLKNTPPGKLKLFLEDSTELDDDEYLLSLPGQSIVIVEVSGNHKKRIASADPQNVFDRILSLVRWSGGVDTVYEEVLEFMKKDFPNKYKQMSDGLKDKEVNQERAKLSTREEDPAWFLDLKTGANTKEEFMFRNSQSRIRGYLSRAEAQLKELTDDQQKDVIAGLVQDFRQRLKINSFHGELFARTADGGQRICDPKGLFKCEGRYEQDLCSYNRETGDGSDFHEINPYASRENRILFSTWNLDHVIERSRSIVPGLVEAIKIKSSKKKSAQLNVEYFYNLMFTRMNLKLVHIVCHDKQQHSSKRCDPKLYFL